MTASTYERAPVRVEVSKKSQAGNASAWERRKADQVVEVRSAAGSIPASLRIWQTVDAATLILGRNYIVLRDDETLKTIIAEEFGSKMEAGTQKCAGQTSCA